MKKQASKQRGAMARAAWRQRRRFMALLVSASLISGQPMANPVGPQVVSGQASFGTQGNVFTITNTPGAIINWQNFSINSNEITRFIQQSGNSAVLNRVTGQNPSQILGALQSNGHVFLINPNGIVFGQGAQIDVNGLAASTLNISNEDFLAGRLNFRAGEQAGEIRNQGSITTPAGGRIFLIAPNVENSGILHSPKGEVVLAAGHSVQLVDSANPALHVVVSAPESQALNLGQVISEGGRIGIYGALINQRGLVSANSAVVGENGKIVFKASKDTILDAGSVTTATGEGQGGEIQVLGQRVGLLGNASVDASGKTGGGTVLVGGDFQGRNAAVQNAKRTYVSREASIKADATRSGNGGKVIVWSDEATRVYGSLSARGGSESGNGGLIETSGHYLDVSGISVNTRAANGRTGSWLLDPTDIEVVNGGSVTSTSVLFGDGPGMAQVDAMTLNSANSHVLLQATNNITITDPVSLAGAFNFTAEAGNNINLNNGITTQGGAVSLTANHSSFASGSGTANIGASINTNGGGVSISGAGVTFTSAGHLLTSGGGVMVKAGATDGLISFVSGAQVMAGSGFVGFEADQISLQGVINTSGVVKLEAASSGRAIHLCSANETGTANTLEFTNAELGNVSAATLIVGNSSSGPIVIKSALTSLGNLTSNLTLESASTISQEAGATIDSGRAVKATGASVTLTEANQIGVIAGKANSGDFQYKSVNGIAVENVDGLAGITSAGNIRLVSDTDISQQAAISGNGLALESKGNVFLSHTGNSVSSIAANLDMGGIGSGMLSFRNSGSLSVASSPILGVLGVTTNNTDAMLSVNGTLTVNGPIAAGNGNVALEADGLALNNTVSAAGVGIRPFTNGRAITVGSSSCAASPCLAISNLHKINAADIGIGVASASQNSGDITIVGITNGTSLPTDINPANTSRIGLQTGGSVTQTGAITVANLGVDVDGSVSLTAANNVTHLVGQSVGNFNFTNAGDLYLISMSGNNFSMSSVNSANGSVSLTSTGGSIDASIPIVAANAVNLSAGNGAIFSNSSIVGASLNASAANGIGDTTPLNTQVGQLSASNSASGNIGIINAGALTLGAISNNAGTGSIDIQNTGAMTVAGNISNVAGTIALSTVSGDLTVNNPITSSGGGIILDAGSFTGNTLTLNAAVTTTDSNIDLKAGTAIVGAANASTSGAGTVNQYLAGVSTTSTTTTTSTSSSTTSSTSTSSTSTSTTSTSTSSTSTTSTSTSSTSTTSSSTTSTASTSTSTASSTTTTASTTTTTLASTGGTTTSTCSSNPSAPGCQESGGTTISNVNSTITTSMTSATNTLTLASQSTTETTGTTSATNTATESSSETSASESGTSGEKKESKEKENAPGANKTGVKKDAAKKLYCN